MSPTLLSLNAFLEDQQADIDASKVTEMLFCYLGLLSPVSEKALSVSDVRLLLSHELERQNRYLFRLSQSGWAVTDREFPQSAFVDEIIAINAVRP
ncbi:hypothetical protein J2Y55_000962 [Bosea sp. BE125]|uniref:hypothetical protein n=1 Tax=Bosea sp. BE125 TaxID=2817909 RepID=UPI00285A6AB7|nr:hypothetical protein [Bosea sp. BE125]MDR6869969.1 hypothetical protein [Bosea sp. BE125]